MTWKKSASKGLFKRRPGMTLVETMLGVVAGSVLLASLAYATNGMRLAVRAIYNEVALQSIVRDLHANLDTQVPPALATVATNTTGKIAMAMNSVAMGNVTMNLGSWSWRWQDGVAGSATPGGELATSSNGTTYANTIGVGSKDMLDKCMFAYDAYTMDDDNIPPANAITYTVDQRIRSDLLRVTAKLYKEDMVPLYFQTAWAPRVINWGWFDQDVVFSPTLDSDGDGVTDIDDALPFDPRIVSVGPGGAVGPTGASVPGWGGLMPIAVPEAAINTTPIGGILDVFEGGGAGNFGWLTWDGNGNAPTLAGMIANPENYIFENPLDNDDHQLDIGDWVHGNTGISNSSEVRDALDPKMNSECVVLVWNQFEGSGSSARYNTVGFAKVSLTSYDLPGKEIVATYMGACDRQGNLSPGVSTSVTAVATTAPSVLVSGSASPSPAATATPTTAPTAAASASPTASPTTAPTATPTATPTPVASPTATPTPVPCNNLYPVGVGSALVAGKAAGASLGVVTRGTGTSNFLWVHWDGSVFATQAALKSALAYSTSTSSGFKQPGLTSDTHLDVGDLLAQTNFDIGASDKNDVDPIVGQTIIVPIFSSATTSTVTVSGFCKIRVTDKTITGSTNELTITFMGLCDSNGN